MKSFDEYSLIALGAAHQAGDFLASRFGTMKEMAHKESTHYVIREDQEANAMYENFLRQRTPEAALYTEEGERNLDSDLIWVVDPLDGTSNYRVGLPLFVTQICLMYKKEPVVCALYNPALGLEYHAQKGKGAFLNGIKIGVSDVSDMKRAMLMVGRGASGGENNNILAGNNIIRFGKFIRALRMFGSTGVDLTFVACGKAEIALNLYSKLYDYAPGVLLVREAGGVVMNADGGYWTMDDSTLVATTPLLKQSVLEILQAAK